MSTNNRNGSDQISLLLALATFIVALLAWLRPFNPVGPAPFIQNPQPTYQANIVPSPAPSIEPVEPKDPDSYSSGWWNFVLSIANIPRSSVLFYSGIMLAVLLILNILTESPRIIGTLVGVSCGVLGSSLAVGFCSLPNSAGTPVWTLGQYASLV